MTVKLYRPTIQMGSVILPEIESYLDVSREKDRGILKRVIRDGYCDVSPVRWETVSVHFVGTYYGGEKDGQQFYSSREHGKCFQFVMGRRQVIESWEVGVAEMRLGEICELITAPEYAYEDGQAMKFEIELLETLGFEDSPLSDGSIRKSKLLESVNGKIPSIGCEVTIEYHNVLDKAKRVVTYINGDPDAHNVPRSLDYISRKTPSGSVVRVVEVHDKPGCCNGDQVEKHNVIYHMCVKSCETGPLVRHCQTFDEKMASCDSVKSRADEFFKLSKYEIALELYISLHADIVTTAPTNEQERNMLIERCKDVKLQLDLVHLKLRSATECLESCQDIFREDFTNEQAFCRIGRAERIRGHNEEAMKYFRRVLQINPANKEAAEELEFTENTLDHGEISNYAERFNIIGLPDGN